MNINIGALDECAFLIEYTISKAEGNKANLSPTERDLIAANIQHLLVTLGRTDLENSIPGQKREELQGIIQVGKNFLLG